MVHYRPALGSIDRARSLRRRMTKAEIAMWRVLRVAFPDHHFRKQVPIGRLTADFASHGAKLIIEVDGGQHGGARDEVRTRVLQAAGHRVIRFWNNDVLDNPDGVARTIDAALVSTATPTPALPPQGGGSSTEPPTWHV